MEFLSLKEGKKKKILTATDTGPKGYRPSGGSSFVAKQHFMSPAAFTIIELSRLFNKCIAEAY